MKITFEHTDQDFNETVTKTIPDDSDIYEFMDAIAGLLVVFGYGPNSIRNGFLSKAEEYKLDETRNKET